MLLRLWRSLKMWRRIPMGPVSLVFRFDRAVRITSGHTWRIAPRGTIPGGQTTSPRGHSQGLEDQSPRRSRGTAIIVGVGPGFGFALARKLGKEGFRLVLVSRDAERLRGLGHELHSAGVSVETHGADATDEVTVARLFDSIKATHGIPTLVVYSVQYFGPGQTVAIELPAFEASWKHNCLGAFLVARSAAQQMLERRSGTIVLIGSTSSLIGRPGHANLAVGKFGQRALAQVMSRELWPMGIHVAHAVIDADIGDDEQAVAQRDAEANPEHIAEAILALHNQPKTAWTSELDLRPWNEHFWEHC